MKKNNTFMFMLGVLLLASTSVMGQWTSVSTTGIENTCNATRVFADGNEVYAYVAGGGLYKSVNGGESWTLFNTGLPAGVEIRGFAVSGTKVYVAANKNGIYGSEKAAASFAKLGTVPVLSNDFTALASIKDTLYLGINGKGVYKCVIPTSTYTQLTSGLANNAAVLTLTVDSITGVGKRLYAGTSADNGFFVKNAINDTWVQKTINAETDAAKKAQVRALSACNGKVIIGSTSQPRGMAYLATTTDFNTYVFTKIDMGLSSHTINAVATDGQFAYLAGSAGVWKSTDLTMPNVLFTQLHNGLQSTRATTTGLILLPNGQLWAAQPTGAFMSADNGAAWTQKLNEKVTPAVINGFKEHEGKLYALTSSGIYLSASGNGGDWTRLGNGLNCSVPAKGLSFGVLGTFATTDGALYKLNGNNWEPVFIDLPGFAWDHPQGGAIADIEQFNNGAKTCLFGSNWRSAGIYRLDGTQWDIYTTTTVNDVTTEMTGDADDGLTLSVANDSSQNIIATKFLYDAPTNTLISFGKNTLQYSKDFGDTWQWKMQGYNIRLHQGNIRTAVMKNMGSNKYVYTGTDNTFGGAWTMGKTEFGTTPENLGGNWVNLSAAVNSAEVRDIMVWDNSPLLIIRNGSSSSTTNVRISTDDGVTGAIFETGLAGKATVMSMGIYGDYVYVGSSTNEIQRYNVKAAPAFVADAPAVTNIGTTTAKLEATSSVASKIYYVAVLKNETAPTVQQIVAGKDAADATAPAAGNAIATANVKAALDIPGLAPNTDYTLYTVAKSETGVASNVTAINFKTDISTGIEDTLNSFVLSPNPTKGLIAIKSNKAITNLKVYNLQGVEVLSLQGAAITHLNLSAQPNGIYLVKIDNSFYKVIKD